MTSKFRYLSFILFFSIKLISQNINLEIINENQKKISNVLVENLRSKQHCHTNYKGELEVNDLQVGDSVRISKQNYVSQNLILNSTYIKVVLLEKSFSIKEIELIGNKNHFNEIAKIDLQTQPVQSSQELLRKVPGLFIGQHAGGGKAEQMFLRGFDLDHGTDINLSVDQMPVNMPSHAHGQGYADMHFVIPETIQKINFDKGSSNSEIGNMATAGYVQFLTKNQLEENKISIEAGKFNSYRMLGLINLINETNQNAYIATDYRITDGFFEHSQNFSRFNLFGKFNANLSDNDQISLSFSHFSSLWDASGQIPDRAVNDGSIGFFGAIDPFEGGKTSRQNINIIYQKKIDENKQFEFGNYFSQYQFDLYSNFTFFLEDPENGDQIHQKENRQIFGSYLNFSNKFNSNLPIFMRSGLGYRIDNVKDLELSHTKNRNEILNRLANGVIQESNVFGFVNWEIKLGKLLIKPGIRLDVFRNDYTNFLSETYDRKVFYSQILSPKLAINYDWSSKFHTFLKLGKGFHSNDTRVVVQQKAKEILPASYNADLGMLWKISPKLLLNSAIWYLFLEQEFVYVGDAAVVEPSGKSGRKGLDLGLRFEFAKAFYLNADYTFSHARMLDEPSKANFIPLAPVHTFLMGLSMKDINGYSGSINTRFLGNRPANEDNSIIAKSYCVTDVNLNYKVGNWVFGLIAENIFNTKWKETQFATESKLKNETESHTEIHFTPGTPFSYRTSVGYCF